MLCELSNTCVSIGRLDSPKNCVESLPEAKTACNRVVYCSQFACSATSFRKFYLFIYGGRPRVSLLSCYERDEATGRFFALFFIIGLITFSSRSSRWAVKKHIEMIHPKYVLKNYFYYIFLLSVPQKLKWVCPSEKELESKMGEKFSSNFKSRRDSEEVADYELSMPMTTLSTFATSLSLPGVS
jgi:hypothetical protein